MATPEQFAFRMRNIGRAIEVNSEKLKRRVAIAVDAQVVTATPVDTGRARSNWLVGLGVPVRTATTVITSAQGAIAQAQALIVQSKPGQAIWISNNVPYIDELNRGTSAQAPAGFVEMAVARGQAIAQAGKVLPPGT